MIGKKLVIFFFTIILLVTICSASLSQGVNDRITLPEPDTAGGMSLTRAIFKRRCIRSFKETSVTLSQLSQILWAGCGRKVDSVTGPTRTAPSAGGLYPVEIYVVAGNVDGLSEGCYSYNSSSHSLIALKEGDLRRDLARASLWQQFIVEAPVTIVIGVVYERTTRKYGERGRARYAIMDAGHVAQNIFLQVVALNLGTTTVGAFSDADVCRILGLKDAEPLYIMPVGHPYFH